MPRCKDEQLIAALLAHTTVRDACKALGIGETQAYARLRDPAFKAKYERARRELLEQSTSALQGRISAAIDTMGDIMADPETPAQTRLNAATAIIGNALKLNEQTDVLTRLEALERLQ